MDAVIVGCSQSGCKHSPVARPPDKEAPTRAVGSAGADFSVTGTGHAKYNESDGVKQQLTTVIHVPLSFPEIVRRSTPRELLCMLELHRQYLPETPIPFALSRAIGRAWAGGAR